MVDPDTELQVINSALDDQRRLIAAGKVQRWDVVKWGVTVNVALATAATLIQFKGAFDVCGLVIPFSFIPSLLAAAVALVSLVLVLYYNYGTTAARTDATYLVQKMKEKHGIDYSAIVGKDLASHYSRGFFYDWPELLLFTGHLVRIGVITSRARSLSCRCTLMLNAWLFAYQSKNPLPSFLP